MTSPIALAREADYQAGFGDGLIAVPADSGEGGRALAT